MRAESPSTEPGLASSIRRRLLDYVETRARELDRSSPSPQGRVEEMNIFPASRTVPQPVRTRKVSESAISFAPPEIDRVQLIDDEPRLLELSLDDDQLAPQPVIRRTVRPTTVTSGSPGPAAGEHSVMP